MLVNGLSFSLPTCDDEPFHKVGLGEDWLCGYGRLR